MLSSNVDKQKVTWSDRYLHFARFIPIFVFLSQGQDDLLIQLPERKGKVPSYNTHSQWWPSDIHPRPLSTKSKVDPIYNATKITTRIKLVAKADHIRNDVRHKLTVAINRTFPVSDLCISSTNRRIIPNSRESSHFVYQFRIHFRWHLNGQNRLKTFTTDIRAYSQVVGRIDFTKQNGQLLWSWSEVTNRETWRQPNTHLIPVHFFSCSLSNTYGSF